MNRANSGAWIFVDLIAEARCRMLMRVAAWCLMPNHFHLVLWPYEDGDLSRWMQWLLTAYVRRCLPREDVTLVGERGKGIIRRSPFSGTR
jgi:REP element-mobilizing transposase RayT